jgi:alkylhydroperoxidase family enzyme
LGLRLFWMAANATSVRGTARTRQFQNARRNGATEQELIEAITHLAFYAGWQRARLADHQPIALVGTTCRGRRYAPLIVK